MKFAGKFTGLNHYFPIRHKLLVLLVKKKLCFCSSTAQLKIKLAIITRMNEDSMLEVTNHYRILPRRNRIYSIYDS